MCTVHIQYYSPREKKDKTSFLELVETVEVKARGCLDALSECLEHLGKQEDVLMS